MVPSGLVKIFREFVFEKIREPASTDGNGLSAENQSPCVNERDAQRTSKEKKRETSRRKIYKVS